MISSITYTKETGAWPWEDSARNKYVLTLQGRNDNSRRQFDDNFLCQSHVMINCNQQKDADKINKSVSRNFENCYNYSQQETVCRVWRLTSRKEMWITDLVCQSEYAHRNTYRQSGKALARTLKLMCVLAREMLHLRSKSSIFIAATLTRETGRSYRDGCPWGDPREYQEKKELEM